MFANKYEKEKIVMFFLIHLEQFLGKISGRFHCDSPWTSRNNWRFSLWFTINYKNTHMLPQFIGKVGAKTTCADNWPLSYIFSRVESSTKHVIFVHVQCFFPVQKPWCMMQQISKNICSYGTLKTYIPICCDIIGELFHNCFQTSSANFM